ncbi:MAG: PorT family protein [Bacteroidales bacterium]|nr:PorT family protein [Bacteroidales bacterium]
MKKIIFLTSLIVILFLEANYAQIKPYKFGFRLAPNISWLSPDSKYYSNNGSDMGFSWGFVSDISLTENYFFQTGFNISSFNAKLEYPDKIFVEVENDSMDGKIYRNYKLRYIEIPALIKMKTNPYKKFSFYGLIGFNFGFNIRSQAEDRFEYENVYDETKTENFEDDIKDDLNFFKLSLNVGVGVEYEIYQSTVIFAGISFNNGVTNILKGYNTRFPDVKQKAIPYSLDFNFGVIF